MIETPGPAAHCRRVALLAAVVLACTVPLAALWLSPAPASRSPRISCSAPHCSTDNIVNLLEEHGVRIDRVDRDSLLLRTPLDALSSDLRPREVYFLGRRGKEPRDLYFAHVILSARGIPVHASPLFSLSHTSVADEQELRYDGERYLAVAAVVEGKTQVVTILDLAGLSGSSLAGFSTSQRLQQRLTNWQETGRWRGLDRIEVRLTVPQPLRLAWRRAERARGGGPLLVASGGAFEVVVDPRRAQVLRGPAHAELVRVGKRSFLAWAVDTVRAFSFVGPEKIAWLEDKVYGALDRARRLSGSKISAVEIRDEMSLPVMSSPASTRIKGWPPAPLRPMLGGALRGEGEWVEVKGPFLRAQPGLPGFFAMTFIRPDAERLFARVYFVAWDPRRLELRMVGGTAEPRSATGELGSGMIPRQKKLLPRVVAAFNGGFQSMHGDFGMMEDRRVVCPPKPWSATVARLADGSTGFGTWDGKAKFGWVPGWIDAFRQNLTPLVEDSVFNPWKRGSWGGGAGFLTGSGPTAQIIRSGLCLHKSGHLMFVLGNPVDGPMLGKAMQKAGCDYAMELDINSGHVGFEFYNVMRADEPEPRGFVDEKYFQRRGSYPGVEQLRYMMREVVRGTGNSPVPRYIGHEARDFFYLVAREQLPPPPLAAARESEGRWTSAALPVDALTFPPAMSRTLVSNGVAGKERRVHLVALDTRWLEGTLCLPEGQAGCLRKADEEETSPSPLAVLPLGDFGAGRALLGDGKLLAGTPGDAPSLVLAPRRPDGPALPSIGARPEASVGGISIQSMTRGATAAAPGRPQAALCPSGDLLFYASGIGATREDLRASLQAAGCKEPVYLGAAEPLVLHSSRGLQTVFGEVLPPVASTPSLALRRSQASWGPRIFSHVKPQPRSVWTLAQPERTRASALRHAKRAAEALGLPPPKTLEDLCHPPYSEVQELKQHRYRDPQTGKTCGVEPAPIKGKGKKRKRHK